MPQIVSSRIALGFPRVARVYVGRSLRGSLPLAILCWVCAIVILTNARTTPELAFGLLALFFPFLTSAAILAILWRARAAFDVPRTFVVDEPGIDVLDDRGGSTRVRWDQIVSADQSREEWVLRLNTKGILILPKEAFTADDQETIQGRLEPWLRRRTR
ncbi:MAG: YcxB family protein [Armatimonadetes bacterium]|nr:YcxB family protein [Armatimonadota bacterium]MCA1996581.1 YcxB family protein [Armatimonadota bacterium]